jgi:hypothetical protein
MDDKEVNFDDDDFAMKEQQVKPLGMNNTGDLVNNYVNSFTKRQQTGVEVNEFTKNIGNVNEFTKEQQPKGTIGIQVEEFHVVFYVNYKY